MDCSPPGSSVHGILQVRKLEWVAISFSRIKALRKALPQESLLLCTAGEWQQFQAHLAPCRHHNLTTGLPCLTQMCPIPSKQYSGGLNPLGIISQSPFLKALCALYRAHGARLQLICPQNQPNILAKEKEKAIEHQNQTFTGKAPPVVSSGLYLEAHLSNVANLPSRCPLF